MLDDAMTDHPEGVVLAVTVVPRAGKTGFDRIEADTVRIRVAAPPVDGAANKALLRYLAEALDRPRGNVRLIAGETSRRKRVLVRGVSRAELGRRLEAVVSGKRP